MSPDAAILEHSVISAVGFPAFRRGAESTSQSGALQPGNGEIRRLASTMTNS
jgi:hypothetical protein